MFNVNLSKDDRKRLEEIGYYITEKEGVVSIVNECNQTFLEIVESSGQLIILTDDEGFYCEGIAEIVALPEEYSARVYLMDGCIPIYSMKNGNIKMADYENGVLEIRIPE